MKVHSFSHHKSWMLRICCALATLLCFAVSLSAQEPTGAIEGTIKDPQGAIVQGATVTARNTTNNATRTATTEENGRFRFSQLPPSTYEVKVTGANFKTSIVDNVKVDVGQNVPLDVSLEVGGANETVQIESGGEAQIDRTDNTVSGVINARQIQELPLNGRNFLDLAQLQPGTEKVDGGNFDPTKANYTGVSIAGQAGRSTQITVDGGSVVDNIVGTTVQNFSQEIVQEFQLGISNFDLSTGASATGSVNIISRSGGNDFHGNLYIYDRHSKFAAFPSLSRLDAANGVPPEAQADRIPFDRQQFGGTISGPIRKDKLFFFFNTEYNNQDGVSIHTLSTDLPGFNGFTSNPFNEILLTGKVDYVINSKTSLFARYSHNKNDQQTPFPSGTGITPRTVASNIFQSNDQLVANRSDGIVVGLTRAFSSNVTNDFHYNYNNFRNSIFGVTTDFPELRVINPDQNFRSGTNYLTPQITTQVRHQLRDDLTLTRGSHTFRFGGDYERTNIGGQFAFAKPARIRIAGPGLTGGGPLITENDYLDSPVFDISLGVGDDQLPFNTPGGATINHRFSVYGNDTWKATHRLTVNAGLSYRIDSNLWNHDLGHPAIVAPLFGEGTAPSPRDKNNIAPRVGFAYDFGGKGKTVLRGGVGMYYDTAIDNLRLFERADLGAPGAELFLVGSDIHSALLPGGDGRFGTTSTSTNGFITLRNLLTILPAVRSDVESRAFNCAFPTSLECTGSISGPLFSTEFQVPYSIQYSLGVQRELPGKLLLQADLNYRKGVHEIITYDANRIQAVDRNGNPLPTPTAFGNSVGYADSSGFSTYKALLLRVDRRFSKGFQMTASYTLSRFKAFGSDTLGLGATFTDLNNRRLEFGPAGLDRTHRLVVSGIYEMPFFRKSDSSFKRNVLGGYTVSVISTAFSGVPLQAFLPDSVNLSGTTQDISSYLPGTGPGDVGRRIHSVGQLNDFITNYNNNLGQYAARTCSEVVGGVTRNFPCDPFGTELRPLALLPANAQIGGDSLISQDVRLTKTFRFSETTRLDLIGEVFNLFNVANLTGTGDDQVLAASADITSPSDITTFRPTSRINSVFGTGGPRAFQFAVKFTF